MNTNLHAFMLEADRDFTSANGIGGSHGVYDEALKQSVIVFNGQNGTDYDPRESLHDYLEAQMEKYG